MLVSATLHILRKIFEFVLYYLKKMAFKRKNKRTTLPEITELI